MCYSQSNLQKLIYIRKANSGYPKLIPKLLSTLVSLADVQITDLNIKKIAFMFTYQRYRAHILFLYIGKMLLNLCFLWKLLYQMVSNFKSNLPLLNQVLLSTNCSLLTQLSNLYMYLPAYMYSGKCYNYPQWITNKIIILPCKYRKAVVRAWLDYIKATLFPGMTTKLVKKILLNIVLNVPLCSVDRKQSEKRWKK